MWSSIFSSFFSFFCFLFFLVFPILLPPATLVSVLIFEVPRPHGRCRSAALALTSDFFTHSATIYINESFNPPPRHPRPNTIITIRLYVYQFPRPVPENEYTCFDTSPGCGPHLPPGRLYLIVIAELLFLDFFFFKREISR